jgi:hypothetical protein
MPEVTLRLRHHPITGERELIINYESDEDALGHEHERDHRRIVEAILGRPLADDETVLVERTSSSQTSPNEGSTPATQTQKKLEENKSLPRFSFTDRYSLCHQHRWQYGCEVPRWSRPLWLP